MTMLTNEEHELIILMAKRIGFSEFKECSVNNDEAYAMRDAFLKVVEKLKNTKIVLDNCNTKILINKS